MSQCNSQYLIVYRWTESITFGQLIQLRSDEVELERSEQSDMSETSNFKCSILSNCCPPPKRYLDCYSHTALS